MGDNAGGSVHPAKDCEACQVKLALYGISYLRVSTGEHIDAPDLLVILGPRNERLGRSNVMAANRAQLGRADG